MTADSMQKSPSVGEKAAALARKATPRVADARSSREPEAPAPRSDGSGSGSDEGAREEDSSESHVEADSRLGRSLGRAGTAVGDSLTRLGDKITPGEAGSGHALTGGAAATAFAAAALGRKKLGRRRRRVAGIPVPGTKRPVRLHAKQLGKRSATTAVRRLARTAGR